MDFNQARQNMILQQVRPWSVFDPTVLEVMQSIPREAFVPAHYANLAYSDIDIPLIEGQTMLPPKVVGRALQALNLYPTDSVLEIGTGTGYVTACLGSLVTQVISIEIYESLFHLAHRKLSENRAMQHIILKHADGLAGYAPQAPYDAIVITGSLPMGVPACLLEQLALGGRIFAICGQAPAMRAVLIKRTQLTMDPSAFETTDLFETVVPALKHAPQKTEFVF